MTHGLCSLRDNFTALRRPINSNLAVALSNPANIEYEVVRTTLLPGLLKTIQHNKSASFTKGFRVFEISDVVVQSNTHIVCDTVVGARNLRRVAAVYAGPTSGFEIVHGLVDRILTLCEVRPEDSYAGNSARDEEEAFRVVREGWRYEILPPDANDIDTDLQVYFQGRCAQVWLTKPNTEGKIRIGSFGILHPEVLANFSIQYPASCLELDLEALL